MLHRATFRLGRTELGRPRRPAAISLAALLIMALVGCGSKSPRTVSVRGRITYGGGDWPAAGTLYFAVTKAADGFPSRPGRADFSVDGRFSATTFKPNDGLMPGEYKVNVECWQVAPSMDASIHPISYLPDKFQSGTTNGLQVVVPANKSGPVEVQFDVPRK